MHKLVFVNMLGKNSEEEIIYEFYFSEDPEMAWGVDWDQKPSSICNIEVPKKMNYELIKLLKTDIVLITAQKNSCFSMQDCKDGVIPSAWEDIDEYDEYPENGRLVFAFASSLDDIENKLTLRGLSFDSDDNLNF